MSEEITVSQIHTTCRNCVFARFENKKQTGCKLNKLQDYENAGINLIDVYDDEEYYFKLIDGRFCMFYRNEEVMEKHPSDSWEEIVKLQTKVPYHAIVFVEKDSTLVDIKKTLHSLKNQEIQPNFVTLINKQYNSYAQNPEQFLKPSFLLELLKNFEFYQFSFKNIYDTSLDDRSLIDLVFDNTKDKPYPFYTVFRAGFVVPKQFSKELNDAILIKMLQIGFVGPVDDLNAMVVNRTAHKKHAGNSFGVRLEDKIQKFEDNSEKFLFESEEIFQCLK